MDRPASESPWRLFLGLWPAAPLQSQIAEHVAQWRWPGAARRTPREQWHLTLHFIGDVPVTQVPALRQQLQVPWEGCTLDLDTASLWPGGIAVLEAQVVPPSLARLHRALGQALRGSGIEVEERPYRPHVTLARRAQGAAPPPAFEPLRWRAGSRYLLVRSLPGGRGYAPAQSFG